MGPRFEFKHSASKLDTADRRRSSSVKEMKGKKTEEEEIDQEGEQVKGKKEEEKETAKRSH